MQAHRRHVGAGHVQNEHSGSASSHRRRRNSTGLSSANENDVKYDHSRKASNGIWSFFRKGGHRRKHESHHTERGDTLLPTTYSNNNNTNEASIKPKRPFKNTTALLCGNHNSFMMGGVDKRRFRRKPKGLLWRIFWSSLQRRLFVSFVLLYIAVYHVLIPFGTWCLFGSWDGTWGSQYHTHGDILARLEHDARFDSWRSIKEERTHWERIRSKLETLGSPRSSSLEAIAPSWYHRNDPRYFDSKPSAHAPSVSHETNNEEETDDDAELDDASLAKDDASEKLVNRKSYERPAPNYKYQSIADNSDGRILQVTGGIPLDDDTKDDSILLPLRTIHNQLELAASFSSCGTTIDKHTTLVIQTSIDRLWILKETCARWRNDPIVVVVFVPHTYEDEDNEKEYIELMGLLHRTEQKLASCPNLTIVRYMADKIESLEGRYPVNRMRNIGLDLVQSSHVMMMDVDFVPSQDLDLLLKETDALTRKEKDAQTAIIVPAFEKKAPRECDDVEDPVRCMSRFLRKDGNFLPRTFDELEECYTHGSKDCVVFQSEYNWDGHSTTRSEEWIHKHWYDDKDERSFRSIPCFHTARYEPYVVLEWCSTEGSSSSKTPIAPYYDERFYGYGKNKIELVSHLRRSGYGFRVFPEGFIIHNPHPESKTKETWNNREEDQLHSTMDALYKSFMGELDVMYRTVHEKTVKLCQQMGH